MGTQGIIWLASYPRSGNTMLRTILWNCFGLRSASIYPRDLGGDSELEERVGHIEHDADGRLRFPPGSLPLLKTHEYPRDQGRAIYVVRDGRPVSVSLWRFYKGQISLGDIIAGNHRFGTWSAHLRQWEPWRRPETLFLKYEDLVADLQTVLAELARFLERPVISNQLPGRNELARDGRWIRPASNWRELLNGELLEMFDSINGEMMINIGYY